MKNFAPLSLWPKCAQEPVTGATYLVSRHAQSFRSSRCPFIVTASEVFGYSMGTFPNVHLIPVEVHFTGKVVGASDLSALDFRSHERVCSSI